MHWWHGALGSVEPDMTQAPSMTQKPPSMAWAQVPSWLQPSAVQVSPSSQPLPGVPTQFLAPSHISSLVHDLPSSHFGVPGTGDQSVSDMAGSHRSHELAESIVPAPTQMPPMRHSQPVVTL